MTKFFTSDTHFGHANVIKYSNRPFNSALEMDEAMIANWNAKVQPNDEVYHLGDLAFAQESRVENILDRLLGIKIFLFGNHDKVVKRSSRIREKFAKCVDYLELTIPDPDAGSHGQLLVLCHYPMITWNKAHHGAWMLHGHCHHNLRYPFVGRILDVGVDGKGYNYAPLSYDEIKAKMKAVKTPQFLDHHRENE